jgi:4'-phosphopantetheinyl transferase
VIERLDGQVGEHGVDLWRIDLDSPGGSGAEARALLSADESLLAARKPDAVAARFVAARAALRTIVSGYLGIEPAAVVFSTGPQGKPTVGGGPQFSLSHSEALGLCAIGADLPIGVDVERVRPVPEAADILARFFSPGEKASYQDRLLAAGPEVAFLTAWTRKEAYLKAVGAGFSDDDAIAREPDLERWAIQELAVPAGYVAALAVARSPKRDGG